MKIRVKAKVVSYYDQEVDVSCPALREMVKRIRNDDLYGAEISEIHLDRHRVPMNESIVDDSVEILSWSDNGQKWHMVNLEIA